MRRMTGELSERELAYRIREGLARWEPVIKAEARRYARRYSDEDAAVLGTDDLEQVCREAVWNSIELDLSTGTRETIQERSEPEMRAFMRRPMAWYRQSVSQKRYLKYRRDNGDTPWFDQ